jgi:hypothetical protein
VAQRTEKQRRRPHPNPTMRPIVFHRGRGAARGRSPSGGPRSSAARTAKVAKFALQVTGVACFAFLAVRLLEEGPRVYASLMRGTWGGDVGVDIARMLRRQPGCHVYTFYDQIVDGRTVRGLALFTLFCFQNTVQF